MQNEPNSQKPKITLIPCSVMTYENITLSNNPKNEPKTNPIFELGIQPSADPANPKRTPGRTTKL